MLQLCSIWLMGIALLVSGNSFAQSRSRAVLVGINQYQADSIRDLNGTHNDVEAMRALLENRYSFAPTDITVLLDEQATHAAILAAIRQSLTEPSDGDDVAVFYFSGHGSQMLDGSGDEADGLDETLVASDSRLPGIYDISDDELNAAFAALAARTRNFTLMLDNCNAGSGARALLAPQAQARQIPADMRPPPLGGLMRSAQPRATGGLAEIAALGDGYTLISGSRAEELSNEDLFDGKIQGALTYHFTQVARADARGTYRSIFPAVVDRVHAQFPSQTPQLEGRGMDSPVFGIARSAHQPSVLVNPDGARRASVRAGTLYGIKVGSLLTVFSPGGEPLDGPGIATLTIDTVEQDVASGTLSGATSIPVNSRARVDKEVYDARLRTVWIDPSVPAAASQQIGNRLALYASLKAGTREAADFRVVAQDTSYRIVGRDGFALSAVDGAGQDAPQRVVDKLHNWARWHSLQDLRNPYGDTLVELSLRPAGTPEGTPAPVTIASGTPIDVTLRNTSSESLFVALLDLSSSGAITALFPAPGAQERLAAGTQFTRTFNMVVPHGQSWVVDTFKVIASTTPIDGSIFEQNAIRSLLPVSSDDPLTRMIALRSAASPREALPVDRKSWSAAQQSVRVNRGGVRFSKSVVPSIALHFDAPTDATAVAGILSRGSRSVCPGDASGTCATAKALSADSTVLEVSARSLRSRRAVDGGSFDSIGQAFDDAYLAGEQADAAYAEPLFEVTVDAPDDGGVRGGDSTPDPIAARDDRWSLRYAAVPGAWAIARQATGFAEGSEAKDIYVGHPDTGFTFNPENWPGSGLRPIDDDHDHDYIDDDDEAVDMLIKESFLSNPGHGTGSGSVIVSPPGCQLVGKTQCVSGTAPGARLMPLRVHTSVVVFSPSTLSRAIEDAANGKWGQRADVISIAMGGPPSRTLHKAVRKATGQGVIIVSAAGNFVQTVVWPARFKEVVAVSAINPKCEPWIHASHGGAVDFSAPGENVWRASTAPPQVYDVGMGAGTTFATGTTSGIAALWLSRHRHDPALAKLKESGATAAAFRSLVQKTAWRPNDPTSPPPDGVSCATVESWRASEYGSGVINAQALLSKPLSAASTRALDTPTPLPLFASLYRDDIAPQRPAEDYRAVFGGDDMQDVARFETEVLFHYTSSDEVRLVIDDLVESGPAEQRTQRVRSALLAQDLSSRLRQALSRQ